MTPETVPRSVGRLDTVAGALDALRAGRPVIVVDDAIRSAAGAGVTVLAIPHGGMILPAEIAELTAVQARTAHDAVPLLAELLTGQLTEQLPETLPELHADRAESLVYGGA